MQFIKNYKIMENKIDLYFQSLNYYGDAKAIKKI
jgi:hypothetical protein